MNLNPIAGVRKRRLTVVSIAAIATSLSVAPSGSAHAATAPAISANAMIRCSVGGVTDTHDSSPNKVSAGAWISCAAPSWTPMKLRIRLYRSGTLVDTGICETGTHGRYCDASVAVTDRKPGKQRWYGKVNASWDSGSKSFTTNSIKH
ncbi:hypothetical protein E1295_14475 [Nonomuraea mesophila]|uniref:Secreted protein n=1 Tax=Nonomuraea mesophila TaxID=2530382 RepID=A0A4R5FNP1_9ACTN|nr:hypothetical protein [Nonomuraea mesophila]TDE54608.1 hypothetical protein E1295_14475 [Nonomuraea mesophila]